MPPKKTTDQNDYSLMTTSDGVIRIMPIGMARPAVMYTHEQWDHYYSSKLPAATPQQIADENNERRTNTREKFGNDSPFNVIGGRGGYISPSANKRNAPMKDSMGDTAGYKTSLNNNDMIYGRARGKSGTRGKSSGAPYGMGSNYENFFGNTPKRRRSSMDLDFNSFFNF